MIQDWNLDEQISQIKKTIVILETRLAKYKFVDLESNIIQYIIPDRDYNDDFFKLCIIKHKIEDILRTCNQIKGE